MLVELPRLGLSFRLSDGLLSCEQYGGLKVLGQRRFHNEQGLQRLVKPFPAFLLLEDGLGELYILSSLAERPQRTPQALRHVPEVTLSGAALAARRRFMACQAAFGSEAWPFSHEVPLAAMNSYAFVWLSGTSCIVSSPTSSLWRPPSWRSPGSIRFKLPTA